MNENIIHLELRPEVGLTINSDGVACDAHLLDAFPALIGQRGPQGEPGPAGADGQAGPQGPAGPEGSFQIFELKNQAHPYFGYEREGGDWKIHKIDAGQTLTARPANNTGTTYAQAWQGRETTTNFTE